MRRAATERKLTEKPGIVVILNDLHAARNEERPNHFRSVQRFMRDLCIGADVVVVGTTSATSDFAYMERGTSDISFGTKVLSSEEKANFSTWGLSKHENHRT